VIVIEKGLADKKGELRFYICEKRPGLSTFTIEKMRKGRHFTHNWNKEIRVPVTTLDTLIKQFGTPKFCKIDVEGFEPNVIKGLHSKIPFISFEFHKEFLEDTKKCINHLESLGRATFNFTLYNKHKLVLKQWVSSQKLFSILSSIKNKDMKGDIYVKIE